MSQINDVHESPHIFSSAGYHALAITHPHTGPVAHAAAPETPAAQRRRVRDEARARKREIKRGAGFLTQLTTTRMPTGLGVNQGVGAPSRRNMLARIRNLPTTPDYLREG